ncbi:hypothetical protein [Hyphomicrobium denitrificans]|uniref:hypothetical protein n=1 Tax=Hyphomicrobium denitrificans TaxID=53399 RepID=UPI0002D86CA9|nr:hypothetical protein [Hyphomicrobium denitrificans]
MAGSSRGRSKLSALDNQPTFAKRIEALRQCAVSLRDAAELVRSEVEHMDAAQERFAARAASAATRKKS